MSTKTSLQLLLLTALAMTSSGAWADEPRLTVAVFDFDSVSSLKVKLHLVTDLLIANLSVEPELVLVDRAKLPKSLNEQALGLSGNITPETAARIGQLTGAKVLITGRLFGPDNTRVLVANIIGAESGRVFIEKVQGSPADLTKLAAELSRKIVKTIAEQATNLVVKVESRNERLDRIIKSVQGVKRPIIRVQITESSSTKTVASVTAETEMGYIFQKAGFTVVDEKSEQKADIEIIGEAVSDSGGSNGELFTGAALIEIKVRERATGKIIAFDRQKSTAVELGRQIVAKTSLENAADELAARLLPLLSK